MGTAELLGEELTQLPVFAELSPAAAREVARGCTEIVLLPGEVLFREGAPPDHLYIVLGGELRVTCLLAPQGDEVVVGVAHQGAVLGEMALLEGKPRSATVRAATRCRAVQLPGERFRALVDNAHPAAWTLLRAMRTQLVARLRAVDERVDAVLEPPTSERDSASLRHELSELWTSGGAQ